VPIDAAQDNRNETGDLERLIPDFDGGSTQPSQFRISDLFALMILSATILVVATSILPLLPGLPPDSPVPVWVIVGGKLLFDTAVIGLAACWMIRKRRRVLNLAGTKLGSGIVGEWRWRHWVTIKLWFPVIFFALFAVAISFGLFLRIGWFKGLTGWVVIFAIAWSLVYSIMALGQLTYWLCRYMWRVPAGTAEFFENGVVTQAVSFFPWNEVAVRPSTVYPDRFVIVVSITQTRPKSAWTVTFKQMYVIQSAPELRSLILKMNEVQASSTLVTGTTATSSS
jgi:hypothetical protein